MNKDTLQGLHLLNTRPLFAGANASLNKQIKASGGYSTPLPLQNITATDTAAWKKTLMDCPSIDIMIFVSVPSVECFFEAIKPNAFDNLKDTQFIAIGSATAKALVKYVHVSHYEAEANSEALFQTLRQSPLESQHIVLLKAKHGRDFLSKNLIKLNAQVTELIVYQSTPITYTVDTLKFLWEEDGIDVVLLTSEQAMHHLWSLLPEIGKQWLRTKTLLVFSKRLQQTAQTLIGATTVVTAHDQIIKSLLQLTNKPI